MGQVQVCSWVPSNSPGDPQSWGWGAGETCYTYYTNGTAGQGSTPGNTAPAVTTPPVGTIAPLIPVGYTPPAATTPAPADSAPAYTPPYIPPPVYVPPPATYFPTAGVIVPTPVAATTATSADTVPAGGATTIFAGTAPSGGTPSHPKAKIPPPLTLPNPVLIPRKKRFDLQLWVTRLNHSIAQAQRFQALAVQASARADALEARIARLQARLQAMPIEERFFATALGARIRELQLRWRNAAAAEQAHTDRATMWTARAQRQQGIVNENS